MFKIQRVLRNVYALERFEGINFDYTMTSITTETRLQDSVKFENHANTLSPDSQLDDEMWNE